MPVVLAFQSNPANEVSLRLDKEIREIEDAIIPIATRDFKLIKIGAVRVSDIPKYIFKYKPDIFHFGGHGMDTGELMFEDDAGNGKAANIAAITKLFELLAKEVKCVVLSCCFAKKQAMAIAQHIPFVIGNTSEVADDLAILFSRIFYGSLSQGRTITESFEVAKAVVKGSVGDDPNDPVILRGKNAALADLPIFKYPTVKACFLLNQKTKRPIKNGREFKMKLWVENLPSNALSVAYNYNHDTVNNETDEIDNDGTGIDTEISLYGTIQIRVMIWFQDEGIGLVSSLFTALTNYYESKKRELTPEIKKALAYIESN